MYVYILILLVLIFGVRRIYIYHCTVVSYQLNVLMKSLQVLVHGVRAGIELTELNGCVLPNSRRREIRLRQT